MLLRTITTCNIISALIKSIINDVTFQDFTAGISWACAVVTRVSYGISLSQNRMESCSVMIHFIKQLIFSTMVYKARYVTSELTNYIFLCMDTHDKIDKLL